MYKWREGVCVRKSENDSTGLLFFQHEIACGSCELKDSKMGWESDVNLENQLISSSKFKSHSPLCLLFQTQKSKLSNANPLEQFVSHYITLDTWK